jgi:hypothetical protein
MELDKKNNDKSSNLGIKYSLYASKLFKITKKKIGNFRSFISYKWKELIFPKYFNIIKRTIGIIYVLINTIKIIRNFNSFDKNSGVSIKKQIVATIPNIIG